MDALPVKAPVNPVEDTDVKPAIVVVAAAPRVTVVLPITTVLFAKFALLIPAVPDKLVLVKPVIVFEAAAIVLFVKVSVVCFPTRVSSAAGRTRVVVPATAVALRIVVPEVEPAYFSVPLLKVLTPVTVCTVPNNMSPLPEP